MKRSLRGRRKALMNGMLLLHMLRYGMLWYTDATRSVQHCMECDVMYLAWTIDINQYRLG